jgi:arginyl-tRNA synthetase
LLGYSVAEIIKASGKKCTKHRYLDDRGIHICKSMLAWQKFGMVKLLNQQSRRQVGRKLLCEIDKDL